MTTPTYNPALHPRGHPSNPGSFAEKVGSPPESDITASDSFPFHIQNLSDADFTKVSNAADDAVAEWTEASKRNQNYGFSVWTEADAESKEIYVHVVAPDGNRATETLFYYQPLDESNLESSTSIELNRIANSNEQSWIFGDEARNYFELEREVLNDAAQRESRDGLVVVIEYGQGQDDGAWRQAAAISVFDEDDQEIYNPDDNVMHVGIRRDSTYGEVDGEEFIRNYVRDLRHRLAHS